MVRAAEPRDAEAAVNVVRRSIVELCVADHRDDADTLAAWLKNKTAGQFTSWLASGRHFCLVAEDDSQLCAVGMLERQGEVQLCYVLPGMQHRGHGSAILLRLEAQARIWGLQTVHLKSTVTSCSFYERRGYRSTGAPERGFGVTKGYPYEKDIANPW